MSNSFAKTEILTCRQCHKAFDADVWLIVDVQEHSDLLKQIQTVTIHELACPYCGVAGNIGAPLLVFRPGQTPPLVFVPVFNATAQQNQQQVNNLVSLLKARMGDAWQTNWLTTSDTLTWTAPIQDLVISLEFQGEFHQIGAMGNDYLQTGERSVLDNAVSVWLRLLKHSAFADTSQDFRLTVFNNAGGTFFRRYEFYGYIEDLNQAIYLWQQTVVQTTPNLSDRSSHLNNLGTGLSVRYAHTGRFEDLEQAIKVYQQAVNRRWRRQNRTHLICLVISIA